MNRVKLFLFSIPVIFIAILFLLPSPALAYSTECGSLDHLSGTTVAGNAIGTNGAFAPGDMITVTVTLNTATFGSFRIVGDPGGVVTYSGPASIPGTLTFTVTGPLPAAGLGFRIDSADGLVNYQVSCHDVPPSGCPVQLGDSRINSMDCAAPVAVYLGTIDVWGIDPATSTGHLDLHISNETIDRVGVPGENTVLARGVNSFTGQPITVYRLSSGQFQLNTYYADGKPYIIAWDEGGGNLVHFAQ